MQIRVNAKCDGPPQGQSADPLFALCSGTVGKVTGNSVEWIAACDAKDPGDVPLLAIRGKWDTDDNAFKKDPGLLTFACAPKFDKKQSLDKLKPITGDSPDPISDLDTAKNLGVLAKCYFWGFGHMKHITGGEESRFLTYQACLRAARAEYCGGGRSQTEEGTIIQVYEPEETKVGKPTIVKLHPTRCNDAKDPTSEKNPNKRKNLSFTPCFEALWDNERALCVSHARYEEMPAQECRKEFPHPFTKSPHEPKVFPATKPTEPVFLHCTIDDYYRVVDRARVKNRSGINTLSPRQAHSCRNDIPCP